MGNNKMSYIQQQKLQMSTTRRHLQPKSTENHQSDTPKQQPFIKTFRKRHRGAPGISSMNQTADLTDYVQPQQKSGNKQASLNKNTTKNNLTGTDTKKQKPKSIQKLNLNSMVYQQQSLISATHKMKQINRIFLSHPTQDPIQAIQSLYQRNEQYLSLLQDWQKEQSYDENDKMVYRLVQHFIALIENIYEKSASQLVNLMESYQNTLEQLNKCELLFQNVKKQQDYMAVLQEQIWYEKQKNNWSTLIFNTLGREKFDFEGYVRSLPEFRTGEIVSRNQEIQQQVSQSEEVNILPCINSVVMVKTKQSVPEQSRGLLRQSKRNSDIHSLHSQCTNIRVPQAENILNQI